MKKSFYIYGSLVLLVLLTLGVTFATFTDKANFVGTTFSVASSDIKLLDVYNGGVDPSNLVDSKPGPTFANITPTWHSDYVVQIYNNGTGPVNLTSKAVYETANDPAELRQIIFVEMYDWVDTNGDGVPQQEEFEQASYGRKTIVKWNTVGFELGTLPQGEIKTLVLRFSTDSISPAKQGTGILFDFSFDALGI
ncbi:MAG TPA: hypothetical protein ENN92_00380 [candidate division WWE3 bacterium]|uniref:Uncharacterized protein n=1 Tax=candidate division WWE3 bacterium TaxID=2053526 RepID=A0A7C1HIT9_UNCKA|nr:hypothetical protein [candidate division WWE3 bacterium]